jgi:hypothetical protein
VFSSFFLRIFHAIQEHPWLRVLVGLILIGLGLVGVFAGGGHGGLIPVGIVVALGGAMAISGPRGIPGGPSEKEQPQAHERDANSPSE